MRLGQSGPTEAAFLQSFCANPKSRAIPEEDLEAVAPTIAKDKKVAAHGILLKLPLGQVEKTVKSFAHVCDSGQKEHAGRRS